MSIPKKPDFSPGDKVVYFDELTTLSENIVKQLLFDEEAGCWKVYYNGGGWDYAESLVLEKPRGGASYSEYSIIQGFGIDDLVEKVNGEISKGFKPLGNLLRIDDRLQQAMFKE